MSEVVRTVRVEQLEKLLAKTPGDAFLLYAMGLELKKGGDLAGAVQWFEKTIAVDGDYLYAYYQIGQVKETMGDEAGAIVAYDEGVKRAGAKGDLKALGELRGAREMLG